MRQRATQSDGCRGTKGQVLPLVLVAVLLAGVAGLGLIRVAVASSRRSAVQAAADAAALAGAAEGEDAARRLAAANGGEVVSYWADGLEVEVVVRRRGVTATARARWSTGRASALGAYVEGTVIPYAPRRAIRQPGSRQLAGSVRPCQPQRGRIQRETRASC